MAYIKMTLHILYTKFLSVKKGWDSAGQLKKGQITQKKCLQVHI